MAYNSSLHFRVNFSHAVLITISVANLPEVRTVEHLKHLLALSSVQPVLLSGRHSVTQLEKLKAGWQPAQVSQGLSKSVAQNFRAIFLI